MNEIEKYKKAKLIFTILGVISTLAVLVYVLIVVFTNSEFNTQCIIAVSVFGGYTLIILTSFFIFDKVRLHLIDKHFGKVASEDIEKSRVLLSQIKNINLEKYQFLDEYNEEEYRIDIKTLKNRLKQISKGHKIYFQLINIYLDIQNKIENSPENNLYDDQVLNAYINELADLFARNKCDI